MVEQAVPLYSMCTELKPVEEPMVDQFGNKCIQWDGSHAGAGEVCEYDGGTETKHYGLATMPIPLYCLWGWERD